MKKRWKGIRTLCLVVCGLMAVGSSARAANGLGVTTHTKKEIAEYIKETQANIVEGFGYKDKPDPGKMTMDGAGSLRDDVMNSACIRYNQYRYIMGLDNVTVKEEYSQYAQAFVFVKAYGGGTDSDKLGETLYNNYLQGQKYCNYATGTNGLIPAIDAWMKDTGTREQMMQASMSETGFGFINDIPYYAAMYTESTESTNAMNVAWPAQVMPLSYFETGDSWTFSTGQQEDISKVQVIVKRIKDGQTWTFDKSNGLTINNTSGQKGCLVFNPNLDSLPSGEQFQVQITGLVQGTVSYSVEFFDAVNYAESTGDTQYDSNGICKYASVKDGILTHDDANCPEKSNCTYYMPAVCNSAGVYEIGNAGQLYWFAKQINDGNTTYNAVLTRDITVNENVLKDSSTVNAGNFMEWTPIGSVSNQYGGSFNGQNHTISGLYGTDISGTTVGLFGVTKASAVISNLGLKDYYFDGASKSFFGSICGMNQGTISDCYVAGYMKATANTNGGICGLNKGTVKNSYSVSVMNGSSTRGGICGSNKGSIANCYFDSDVCSGSLVDSSCGKATTAFKSGEAAYLLQNGSSAWGQTIGVDAAPVLNGKKVYQITDQQGTVKYSNSNTSETPTTEKHHYNANGQCTNCSKSIGTIKNNNYNMNYTYSGQAISTPTASNFTIPEGAATPTFTWYDGDQTGTADLNSVASQKRNTTPVDAGTYTLVVETPAQETTEATYDASSFRIKIEIAKADSTGYTKPADLTAKCGDMLSTVSLKVDGEKGSFVWTDTDVKLEAGSSPNGQTVTKKAKYIPADTKNYNEVTGIELSIGVTHQTVTDPAVDATCETAGKTQGSHCSACNTVFVTQNTVAPTKHHYNADGQCTKCSKTVGTITNNNYKTSYTYSGYTITEPVPANFTIPTGAAVPTFTWYDGNQTGNTDLNSVASQKRNATPVDAGTYTLVVETPAQETDKAIYEASSLRIKVEIAKADPTGYTQPADLTAKCGDMLSTVSLKVDGEKGSFVWMDTDVKLEAGSVQTGQTVTKKAKYIPADTKNYNEVTGIELSIEVTHSLQRIDETSHNAQCTACNMQYTSSTCTGGKATCTTPAICDICGQSYGSVDTVNGHKYEPSYNWSEDGTSCTIEFICTNQGCNETVQNHKLTDNCKVTSKQVKPASCTDEGITQCTAAYKRNGIDYETSKEYRQAALGHDWDEGKVTTEPTKEKEGIRTFTCKNCSKTKTETIAKLTGDSDNPGGNTGDKEEPSNPGGNTGDNENPDNPGGNTGDNENPSNPGENTDNGQQPSTPSDTTGGGQQPPAPTDNTETVKVGMVTSDDKAAAKYQITNVDKKEVSFVKPVNKKAKKITVPDTVKIDGKTYKVTCISSKAFSGANKCKTITIGKNVTSIKANAFSGCKNVKTIIFKTTKLTKKTVAKNAFKGITKKTTIKVPKKKVSSYKKIFKSKGLSLKVKVKA